MRIDVLSLFPDFIDQATSVGVVGRARERGLLQVQAWNPRDYATDNYRRVDDRPFGGGPGMVMMCQPVWDAVRAVEASDPRPARRILMTPQGVRLDQPLVEELAREERLLIIAGHYEGIDERVVEALAPLEISLGDYVLSGGELAAVVLIDAVCRLLPGALGDEQSAGQDSFSPAPTHDAAGTPVPKRVWRELGVAPGTRLLDCPHYTRPRVWEGRAAPDVLFSGDHGAVARWRLEQMLRRTRERRPDLLPPESRV